MIKIRTKKISENRSSIYLDIYSKGKRKFKYLNIYLDGDKKQDDARMQLAEQIAKQTELELIKSNYNLDIMFSNAHDYIAYLEKMLRERPRYEKLKTTINHLKIFCPEGLPFGKINTAWYDSFDRYLRTKMKGNSINNILVVLKMSLSQAVDDGIIKKNPLRPVKKNKDYSKRSFLVIEELKKLAETPCPKRIVKDAFLFSCYTGLRLCDVEVIKWRDIVDGQVMLGQQKTGEPVFVPIGHTAQLILDRLGPGKSKDNIFSLPSHATISVALAVWTAAAGITKHITYHCSRHTFATLSLTYGTDLYTVSKLLGHTDIHTTQIYAEIINEKKRQAIDNLPDIKI